MEITNATINIRQNVENAMFKLRAAFNGEEIADGMIIGDTEVAALILLCEEFLKRPPLEQLRLVIHD